MAPMKGDGCVENHGGGAAARMADWQAHEQGKNRFCFPYNNTVANGHQHFPRKKAIK